jgi:hypothetical protein
MRAAESWRGRRNAGGRLVFESLGVFEQTTGSEGGLVRDACEFLGEGEILLGEGCVVNGSGDGLFSALSHTVCEGFGIRNGRGRRLRHLCWGS